MNVVEQQLLAALRETPAETDCSVSARVLEWLGHATRAQQESWLTTHRLPRDGKQWFLLGDRWEYCATAAHELANPVSEAMRPRVTAPARAGTGSIVVKPLAPLLRSRR